MVFEPRVDLIFKKIFGSRGNEDLLEGFINFILPEKDQVCDINLLNYYDQGDLRQPYALSDFDIEARVVGDGGRIGIVMQFGDEEYFKKRDLFRWAEYYSRDREYARVMQRTVGIRILNFMNLGGSGGRSYYKLFGPELTIKPNFTSDFGVYVVELSRLDEGKGLDGLDGWSAFFVRSGELLGLDDEAVGDSLVRKALKKLRNVRLSSEEAEVYGERLRVFEGKMSSQNRYSNSRFTKVICIHLLNFGGFTLGESYHNRFIVAEGDEESLFEGFSFHIIELKKFKGANAERLDELIEKVETALDLWVAFLIKSELLEYNKLPEKFNDPLINKALHVIEEMGLSKKERDRYNENLDWLRMEVDAIAVAEKRGEKRGLEEVEKIGVAKEKSKVAKKLLDKGIELEMISYSTGLSLDELEKLRVAEL